MKTKYIFYALLATLALINACDDDDDEKLSIVGKWQAVRSEVEFYVAGVKVYENTNSDFDAEVEFKSDGIITIDNNGQITSGIYEVRGDQLITNVNFNIDGIQLPQTLTIRDHTRTTLQLFGEQNVSANIPDIGNAQGTGKSNLYFTRTP